MPSFTSIIAILAASATVMALPSPQLGGLTGALGGLGGTGAATGAVSGVTGDVPDAGAVTGTTGAVTGVTGDLPAGTTILPDGTAVLPDGTTADPAVSSSSVAAAMVPQSCSKNTTISCCNTDGASGLLGDVLGGSCSIPNLAVLGVTSGSQCPGANTYCCPTTQTGDLDINAACLPLAA